LAKTRYLAAKQRFGTALLGDLLWQWQATAGACHLLRSPHRKLNAKTIGEAVLWLSFSMHVKE
jgi:hypothetical protein